MIQNILNIPPIYICIYNFQNYSYLLIYGKNFSTKFIKLLFKLIESFLHLYHPFLKIIF